MTQTLDAQHPTALAADPSDKVAQLTVRAKAVIKAWENAYTPELRKLNADAGRARAFLKTLKEISI